MEVPLTALRRAYIKTLQEDQHRQELAWEKRNNVPAERVQKAIRRAQVAIRDLEGGYLPLC